MAEDKKQKDSTTSATMPVDNPIGRGEVERLFRVYTGRTPSRDEIYRFGDIRNSETKVLTDYLTTEKKMAERELMSPSTVSLPASMESPQTRSTYGDGQGGEQEVQNLFDGDIFLIKFSEEPTPSDQINDTDTIWLQNKPNKLY